MARFLDGPAQGQPLLLKRAPKIMRVTCGPGGKWDGLDQLRDQPAADEAIFVYVRLHEPHSCHLRMRGGGGFYQMADYAHVNEQVPDEVLRDTAKWREWCVANWPRLDPGVTHAQ